MSTDYDLIQKASNNYINIVDTQRTGDSVVTNTDRDLTAHVQRARDSNNVVNRSGRSPSPVKKKEVSPHRNDTVKHVRLSEKREVEPESRRDQYWAPNMESITETERKTETSGRREELESIDRQFYERKIHLLEQRLESSDREINNIVTAKGVLNGEIVRLKAQMAELQGHFVEDLNRSLKAQEERLRREFSEQEKYREEESREKIRYLERIEELTVENKRLQEDMEDLARRYERMKQEKDAQIKEERQRNERSLKSSMGSEGRSSVANTESKLSEEQLKGLVEALGMYKHELESLKANNRMIQVQFEEEIHALKDELHYQKEHNMLLEDRIQAQNQVLEKVQHAAIEASNRKEQEMYAQKERERDLPSAVKFDLGEQQAQRPESKHRREYSRDSQERNVKSETRHKREHSRDSQAYSNNTRLEEKSGLNTQGSVVISGGILKDTEQRSTKRVERDESSPNQGTGERESAVQYSPDNGHMPFTNNDIKTGILNQQERKGRTREVLYQQLVELQHTPKMKSLPKSRSKTRSKSKSAKKVRSPPPEEEVRREKTEGKVNKREEKSPGTAYEEFEEELQRLKGAVSTKLSFKKAKRKESASDRENQKENSNKGKRKESYDAKTKQKDHNKSEKKSANSSVRTNVKTSPNKSVKLPTSSKSGKRKAGV